MKKLYILFELLFTLPNFLICLNLEIKFRFLSILLPLFFYKTEFFNKLFKIQLIEDSKVKKWVINFTFIYISYKLQIKSFIKFTS